MSTDVETKPALSNKKNNLKCERSLRDYPFKKRKLYDCSSVSNSNSDRGISNDGNCSSHTKGYKEDASNYTPTGSFSELLFTQITKQTSVVWLENSYFCVALDDICI